MRLVLLPIFLMLFPGLARAIQGGAEVPEGSPLASLTVAVQFQMGDGGEWWHHCTAVIWDDDLVITAAHCVPAASVMRPLRIAFTADEGKSSFESRPVTATLRDEDFEEDNLHAADDHDIALMRFAGGIPSGFRKASLIDPQNGALVAAGTPVIVSGFGSTSFDRYDMGILRSAKVAVASARHGHTEILLDQRPLGGACSGDSGGPAFLEVEGQLVLLGITSRIWPLRASDCGQFMIYTRVDARAAWLERAARQVRDRAFASMQVLK